MDRNEEILLGSRRRRGWIAIGVAIPFLAAIGLAVWFFLRARAEARDEVLVENVTSAAFGCVASIRGDAPEAWGLERALEHMSRMERVTRDAADPTTREERERFGRLAADAALGCEELGRLMTEAHAEAPHLYFAVPASLAQPPDTSRPEAWFRRALPESRTEVLELTRQIRTMAEAINGLRTERALMAQDLPVEGRGPSELARIVTLSELPRDREDVGGEAWPLADGALVLRRGAIGRVPCETRFLNRASCFNEFVQQVSWQGELTPLLTLERPANVTYWAAFTVTPDGRIWAVGLDGRNRGIVGRYEVGAATPETATIEARIDGAANIVAVANGVAVFPADGSAWIAEGGELRFARSDSTSLPVVITASHGPEGGVELEGYGHLSIFGSEEAGWTSRLTPSDGEDVLLRILDAHSRVQRITQLRTLRSGKVVALVERGSAGPNAVLLSETFGRRWLVGQAAAEE